MLGFDISQTQTYRHFSSDFQDLGRIGTGGFAQVHKVRSRLDNRVYALKIISIRPSQCKQDIIQTIHKFLDQVKILSYLNHKNIIHYHGCWIQTQKIDQNHTKNQSPNDESGVCETPENEEEIVMVMEQEFSSSGIHFGQQSSGNHASHNNNDFSIDQNSNNLKSPQNYHNKKNKKNQIQNFNQQQEQTKQTVENNTVNFVQIPIDHSAASINIRNEYKLIKIFILTQLGEGNLQQYLYKRNIERKSTVKDTKNGCSNHEGNNNNKQKKCEPSSKNQNGQQTNQNEHLRINHICSSNKKLPSHLHFQQPISRTTIAPDELSHIPSTDQLLTNYKMIIQIIEGLEYLHSKKIIHRDVKLHNIVIDSQKKCKIIDYGLAKKTRMLQSIDYQPKDFSCQNLGLMHLNIPEDEKIDQIFSSSVGTRIYSSPQQIISQRYDHRTDIYSLSIVILMFFCDFTTNHEELSIIQRIRKIDIGFIQCDQRLKKIMTRCLGEEKNRPRLTEIKHVVRQLLRQRYQIRSRRQMKQKSLSQKQNILEKQESIYIMENAKLKKKISKQEYITTTNFLGEGRKQKQASNCENLISEENEEEKKQQNKTE